MNIIKVLEEAKDKFKKSTINTGETYIPVPKNVYEKLSDKDKENANINWYEFIEIKPLD